MDFSYSQSSERVDFYGNHEEADTKMFAYIKFLCDNILLSRVAIVSPDADVAVISLYESFTNVTFLDAIWFKTGAEDGQRYTSILASELGLPICCLLLATRAVSGCEYVCTFSHIEKIVTFQTLKKKK